jgi:hypothetical protein
MPSIILEQSGQHRRLTVLQCPWHLCQRPYRNTRISLHRRRTLPDTPRGTNIQILPNKLCISHGEKHLDGPPADSVRRQRRWTESPMSQVLSELSIRVPLKARDLPGCQVGKPRP